MRVLFLEQKDYTFNDVVNYMLHVREAPSSLGLVYSDKDTLHFFPRFGWGSPRLR